MWRKKCLKYIKYSHCVIFKTEMLTVCSLLRLVWRVWFLTNNMGNRNIVYQVYLREMKSKVWFFKKFGSFSYFSKIKFSYEKDVCISITYKHVNINVHHQMDILSDKFKFLWKLKQINHLKAVAFKHWTSTLSLRALNQQLKKWTC